MAEHNKIFSPTKAIRSFRFAIAGIGHVIKSENNFRFHLFATFCVLIAAFFLKISQTEWLFIILAIGMVLIAEAFNSAIEKLVDLASPQKQPLAGWIKDVAAGAVLLAAIAAAIIGLVVFVPYILRLLAIGL